MGSTKDKDSSKMLHNQKLSEALQSKTCFTLEEWKAFGIEENLSEDSFVKTIDDEFYFRPNCSARNLHRVVLRIMKYAMVGFAKRLVSIHGFSFCSPAISY